MIDLPKNQRVQIQDGKYAGEVGIFEKTYSDGMSSILLGGNKTAFCREFSPLTMLEEAQLIAKSRGKAADPDEDDHTTLSDEPKKRRGRIAGSKNKPKPEPTRAFDERPGDDDKTEPMLPSYPVPTQEPSPAADRVPTTISAPTPLLIIVEPDGTVVHSASLTKANMIDAIRSLIDLAT